VLSLYLPSPHAALYDRGEFISCTGSVPSPMTLALRRKPNGSALPKFPSSVSDGGWFRGFTGSLLRCGLSSCSPPCTDLTRHFSQPTGTFTPELPASRSPFSSSGITTVAPERLHRWDFHPLERQLASLHRLFHPLLQAGLARRTVNAWSIRGDVKDIFLPRPEEERDSVTSSPCSLCTPLGSGFLPSSPGADLAWFHLSCILIE